MPSPCALKLEVFFQEQLLEWPLLAQAVGALSAVKVRELTYQGDKATIQFNPARIKSVAAKVDAASLAARPCFLCDTNRPAEQREFQLLPRFIALCNPVPIFDRHLTVNCKQHRPQLLLPHIEEFLNLSKFIGDEFSLFFNGALAGASAPDHLHFQCCKVNNTLPLIDQALSGKGSKLKSAFECELSILSYFGVGALVARANGRDGLVQLLTVLLENLGKAREQGADLINVVSNFQQGSWIVTIIPRKKHRPTCYSLVGDTQLLISPGTVEVCGTVITPREEDFRKVTVSDLSSIFSEVAYSQQEVDELVRSIQ